MARSTAQRVENRRGDARQLPPRQSVDAANIATVLGAIQLRDPNGNLRL